MSHGFARTGANERVADDRPCRPNLFVIGAPKCGTTSLCHYLGQHPDIFFPRLKEPLFFCTDSGHAEPWRVTDPDRYLALFVPGAGKKWRGEGSVWYLHSEIAARRIRDYSRDARIIVMLRNPVDMVASLHAQFLFTGNENIGDFEAAYAAQDRRTRGRNIPWRAHTPEGLLYTEVGRYAAQVARYRDVFPAEHIKILIFEEFFADAAGGYREILDFLGVAADFAPDFTIENERHNVRSPRLQRFLTKIPELWGLPGRLPPGRLRDGLQRRVDSIRRAVSDFNGRGRGGANLPPELRRRLHRDFADDIARLESLLGRDLSLWRARNGGASGHAPARATSQAAAPTQPRCDPNGRGRSSQQPFSQ